MQILRIAVSTVLLAGLTTAQTNFFQIFPDEAGTTTSFTSRMSVGTGAGENLAAYGGAYLRGVGQARTGQGCGIEQFMVLTQDQNCSTDEQWNIVFRSDDTANPGRPDGSAAGAFFTSGTLGLPPNGPPSPCAWLITVTLGTTPVKVPCEGGWHPGIRYSPNGAWTNDGQSIHYASYDLLRPTGDNPRAGAPPISYQVISNVTSPPVGDRTARLWVGTDTAFTRVGGKDPAPVRPTSDPNYGAGGVYPRITDGLAVEHIDGSMPNGFFLVLLGVPGPAGGIGIGGVEGRFWLAPAPLFVVGVGALGATGRGSVVVAPAGSIPANLAGSALCFTALGLDAQFQRLALGNEWDVRL